MRPSAFPEVAELPHLRRLLALQVDMQVGDLETMLRLPQEDHGLGGGMNLAATSQCLALLAGTSVLLYDADIAYFKDHGGARRRFRELIVGYAPLDRVEVDPDRAADLLWTFARNPLTHAFGIGKMRHLLPGFPRNAGDPAAVMLGKYALSETQAAALVRGDSCREPEVPFLIEDADGIVDIHVPSLAWATIATMRSVLKDDEQSLRAEELAEQLLTG